MLNKKHSNLQELGKELGPVYQNNPPFPNIYLDEFFDETFLSSVLDEFPDLEKAVDKIHYKNPNENKLASNGRDSFKENTKKLVDYLNSETFMAFLQEMTGIKEPLIADPQYEGGGFHEIKKGGFLKLHVDFHKHRKLNLDRRLNLLVYLNKDWEESYGGNFELWEKDMSKQVVKILPIFNRMALFSTTGDSWHGHPDTLTCPDDRSRKSLALYYYTEGRPDNEVAPSDQDRVTTTFIGRKGIDSPKMKVYNKLVNVANAILPNSVVKFLKSFRKK